MLVLAFLSLIAVAFQTSGFEQLADDQRLVAASPNSVSARSVRAIFAQRCQPPFLTPNSDRPAETISEFMKSDFGVI